MYAGNETAGFIGGTYNNKVYCGSINFALSSWTDLIVNGGTADCFIRGTVYAGGSSKSSTRGYEGYVNIMSGTYDAGDKIGLLISGTHNSTGFLNDGIGLQISGQNNDGSGDTPKAYYWKIFDENLYVDSYFYTTSGGGDGRMTIGASSAGSYHFYVAGNAYATGTWSSSDARCKKNIQDYDTKKCLDACMKMKVRSYTYEKPAYVDDRKTIGIIAQEIEEIEAVKDAGMITKNEKEFQLDRWGKDADGNDDKNKPKSDDDVIKFDDFRDVEKTKMLWLLLGSVQELQQQITNLKMRWKY